MENNQNNNTTKEKTAENKNHNFLYELGKNIELICNILDDTAANLEEKKQKSLFLSIEWDFAIFPAFLGYCFSVFFRFPITIKLLSISLSGSKKEIVFLYVPPNF